MGKPTDLLDRIGRSLRARLSGTIYYNSYGTQLAKNFTGAVGGDGLFGGATLSIRVGDSGPALTAGKSGSKSKCRVCHSVSADGSRLISSAEYGASYSYDLKESPLTETALGLLAEFPGIYPDGSMALTANGQMISLSSPGTVLTHTGLTSEASALGTPMFSPDGKRLAFNPTASTSIAKPTQKLIVADFDFASLTFSNLVEVADYGGESAAVRPGWPAFFPDSKSLVFHQQSAAGNNGVEVGDLRTRWGARAQLQWTSLSSSSDVTPLNNLNGIDSSGKSYLAPLDAPVSISCVADGFQVGNLDTRHEDDANLNYEPTVNPVADGGYAWVVFTSRRRYGNVATIPPFCSDPRDVDLVQNITTKKLWVAAIDLNAERGTDSSHPAFYLPGQELLAGNSRGFWVRDPCRPKGDSCSSGDQCCEGFCRPDSEGELVCSPEPPEHSPEPPEHKCSLMQERCESANDCCDAGASCIGGFCAQPSPR